MNLTNEERKQIIKDVICHQHGTTWENVKENRKNRTRDVVEVRQKYFYLVRKYTTLSHSLIGQELFKDHATVISAVKLVNNLMDSSKPYKNDIDLIKGRVEYEIKVHEALKDIENCSSIKVLIDLYKSIRNIINDDRIISNVNIKKIYLDTLENQRNTADITFTYNLV